MKQHKDYIRDFLKFCDEHEERCRTDLAAQKFYGSTQRLEYMMAQNKAVRKLHEEFCGNRKGGNDNDILRGVVFLEQTYGIDTSFFGMFQRRRKPHAFHVQAKQVGTNISSQFHKNVRKKLIVLIYQLFCTMK